MSKKILILCRSDLSADPRVIRQLRALPQDEYEVHCVGLTKNNNFKNTFYKIEKRSMTLIKKLFMRVMLLLHVYSPLKFLFDGGIHFYESGFKKLDTASMPKFDVIIANDLDTLEFAAKLKKITGAALIYDSHECWTAMYEDQFEWRVTWMGYMKWLSKKLLPHCDKVITVSDGIAGRIQAESGKKPSVIRNAPPFAGLAPVNCDGRIRLIHQGYAHKSRHLELMIEMMDYLDERFTLDMLLISSGSKMSDAYLAYLGELGRRNPRINFPPAVNPDEVSDFINKYDIGVYLMPPVNFNHKYALPNKLFQFIQARIAVAIGPSPDMAQIVREHDIGVVADDFSPRSLAEKLNSLTSDMIMKYKMNSDAAAKIYNSENEEAKLLELIASIGGNKT